MGQFELHGRPDRRDHAASRLDVPDPQVDVGGATSNADPWHINYHRCGRMGSAQVTQVLGRVHMGEGCKVPVGLGPPVGRCIPFAPDGAPYEDRSNSLTCPSRRIGDSLGKDAHLNSTDHQGGEVL